MPSKLGIHLHRESRAGKVAGRLKGSHTEPDPQRQKNPNKSSDFFVVGDPDGNRTRVTAVKGRCLSRLTTGPLSDYRSQKEAVMLGSGNRI